MTYDAAVNADGTRGAPEALFDQVTREPRLSDKVADMMLETILSRRLHVGDRLPSERELGEQFGVSRTVVREAVRALVAKGVIEVRSVADCASPRSTRRPSASRWGSSPRGSIDFEKVHEVRRSSRSTSRASRRALDRRRRGRLREVHERMQRDGDVDAAARDDLEFHRSIARATQNDLYLLLMDSIGSSVDIRREPRLRLCSDDSRAARCDPRSDLGAGSGRRPGGDGRAPRGVAAWWRSHSGTKRPRDGRPPPRPCRDRRAQHGQGAAVLRGHLGLRVHSSEESRPTRFV